MEYRINQIDNGWLLLFSTSPDDVITNIIHYKTLRAATRAILKHHRGGQVTVQENPFDKANPPG